LQELWDNINYLPSSNFFSISSIGDNVLVGEILGVVVEAWITALVTFDISSLFDEVMNVDCRLLVARTGV
jgi:hypothetical protein